MMNTEDRANYNFQKVILLVAILLFLMKFVAWYITSSVAILTDALESITNMLAGAFTLFSLYLSAKPKDRNHPHGHGKIEFISASVEGTLILVAGIIIIYEGIKRLIDQDSSLTSLGSGLVLIAITAIINYVVGFMAIQRGKKYNVLPLIAGGKHLHSDTYSTVGIILGLILVWITGWHWLDAAIALLFGCIIIHSGVKIMRESIAGIMDEVDEDLIEEFVEVINENRSPYWVDLHKVRFIKYGNHVHLDAHLTLPWYLDLRKAHEELDKMKDVLVQKFGERHEMYIHTDDCKPFSCEICPLKECAQRQFKFIDRVEWTAELIAEDQRHSIKDLADQKLRQIESAPNP